MAATAFYSDPLFQHLQYGPAAQLPNNPQDYPVGFRYLTTDTGQRFVIQQDDTGPLPVRAWANESLLAGPALVNGSLVVTGLTTSVGGLVAPTLSNTGALSIDGNPLNLGTLLPTTSITLGRSGQITTAPGILLIQGNLRTSSADISGAPATPANTISGRTKITNPATSVAVTNGLVGLTSHAFAVVTSFDASLPYVISVQPGTGFMTISVNVTPAVSVEVDWFVVNP